MSIQSARSTLADAHDLLMHRWGGVCEHWDDGARHEFEREVILPVEEAVRAALSGMATMEERLAQAKGECA